MSNRPNALRLADAITTHQPLSEFERDCIKAAAELRRLHSLNAELLEALRATKATLQRENERDGGAITDTIWHSGYETLFDFIDSAIENAEAAQ